MNGHLLRPVILSTILLAGNLASAQAPANTGQTGTGSTSEPLTVPQPRQTSAPGNQESPPNSTSVPSQHVPANVLIVLAKAEEGTVDPSLANEPAFQRAPFNQFRSMRVLSRPSGVLSANSPMLVELPNGRRLQIQLNSITSDGRYRVRVSINRPGQTDYLPVMSVVSGPGEPFFVAGQSFQGGTLVIGVRVGNRLVRHPVPPTKIRPPPPVVRPPRTG